MYPVISGVMTSRGHSFSPFLQKIPRYAELAWRVDRDDVASFINDLCPNVRVHAADCLHPLDEGICGYDLEGNRASFGFQASISKQSIRRLYTNSFRRQW
jgi:hypothetical protein